MAAPDAAPLNEPKAKSVLGQVRDPSLVSLSSRFAYLELLRSCLYFELNCGFTLTFIYFALLLYCLEMKPPFTPIPNTVS